MENLQIRQCDLEDIEKIKNISEKTFCETFADYNSEKDMRNYIEENFSYEKLESEINNSGSQFYMVEDGEDAAGYMKVNFYVAQTESGYNNSLEVQRIYILEKYKGKKIGTKLIEKSMEIGKNNNLDYIWLGVWEHGTKAIRFYEKQGFEKFDTHIFRLGDDEQTDNLMRFML